MTWTPPTDIAVGAVVTDTIWNAHNGAAGNSEHLHSGRNIKAERLTHVSGSVWQTSSNYLAGKWLLLTWKGLVIPTDATTAWITESAANQITFTTAMKDALNGGDDIGAGQMVFAVFLVDE